ncbi:MAG: GNAT family N-acetyltransferase, partial [Atopobiaceae bacterium]|nr:GNAT family N-acetyltransferase [Atopobiaceae bacterium]
MLDITLLSSHYDVRPLTEDDVDKTLRIYQSNPQFFAYCAQRPTKKQVLSDMRITPPGTGNERKHFVGFFSGDELVAIMDLVDGYPEPEVAYIGLFMVDARFQGRQVGSSIIEGVKHSLRCVGKKAIRLAINKGNLQATHFWEKHGFVVIREVENDGWPLLEAECGILNRLHIPTERGTMSSETRPIFPARCVITGGMPYGNKNLHFGHIGGVFVPADFFARFLRDRIGAENVIFVSGTDCYGSPIMEGYRKKVEDEGYTGSITDYVQANHDLQKEALDAYGISLDIFGGSGLEPAKPFHAKLSHDLICRLYERGYLHKLSTRQFYDVQAGQFLNGRQVIGRCPVQGCKSEKAYADECDLGHQFDPEELISPISQLTKTTPELCPVDKWY